MLQWGLGQGRPWWRVISLTMEVPRFLRPKTQLWTFKLFRVWCYTYPLIHFIQLYKNAMTFWENARIFRNRGVQWDSFYGTEGVLKNNSAKKNSLPTLVWTCKHFRFDRKHARMPFTSFNSRVFSIETNVFTLGSIRIWVLQIGSLSNIPIYISDEKHNICVVRAVIYSVRTVIYS